MESFMFDVGGWVLNFGSSLGVGSCKTLLVCKYVNQSVAADQVNKASKISPYLAWTKRSRVAHRIRFFLLSLNHSIVTGGNSA